MALIDSEAKRIDSRVVIYGPSGAGKSTFLQTLQAETPGSDPVQIVSDEMIGSHEVLWISLGELRGFTTRFHVTTIGADADRREHRRMLLQHVDGVVFVADALPGRDRDNAAAFSELETLLGDWGTPLSKLPFVVFVNKRDLPGAVEIADVVAHVHGRADASPIAVGGSAKTGDGVLDGLKAVAKQVLAALAKPG